MHFLPILMLGLLTPIRAAPRPEPKHKHDHVDKDLTYEGVGGVHWAIIPAEMMGCWIWNNKAPDEYLNWTALEEASDKLKEWGVNHKIAAGNLFGIDVVFVESADSPSYQNVLSLLMRQLL
ncbi:hypothetical protein F5Y14DRAFT_456385 [Nemania sp. NC0429]|nr:hypothetical protein F5Y14DRAFT_456385 [Nemania sp. NC0429]